MDNSGDHVAQKEEHSIIRCQNRKNHVHLGRPKEGNIVAFLGRQSIVLRCNSSTCRHWTALEFDFNGLNIDLRKVGIVQTVIPPNGLKLNTSKAAVILDGES